MSARNKSHHPNHRPTRRAARRWTTAAAICTVLWSGVGVDLKAGPVTVGPVHLSVSYHHG